MSRPPDFSPSDLIEHNLKFFPEMLEQGLKLAQNFRCQTPRKKFNKIILAGMGGSGIAGEIVKTMLEPKIKIPIFLANSASLPNFSDEKSFLLMATYSGNTQEMLLLFRQALKKKMGLGVVSSGGQVSQLCQKFRVPLFLIPQGLQPRAALGYFLTAIFSILEKLKIAFFNKAEWLASAEKLKNLRKMLEEDPNFSGIQEIAAEFAVKIPVILAASGTTAGCGYRFKTQLNENAKTTAHLAVFPELVHNEIMNLATLEPKKNPFSLLILESDFDAPLIKKMQKVAAKILQKTFPKIHHLKAQGKTLLEQILYLIFLTDMISLKVAERCGVAPTPIKFIEQVKEFLKSR